MEQQHGIPQRIIIKDKPWKTRQFILYGSLLWLACLGFDQILEPLDSYTRFGPEVNLANSSNLIAAIFVQSIVHHFPIIVFFAIFMKIMTKGMKKILERNNKATESKP